MTDRSFRLVIRKGPKPGQVFPLVSPSVSIGRDPMSDITLPDPEVSRYHAQLVQTESGYQIQDMGSTNGTFVDDKRLGSDALSLVPGMAIRFGSAVVLDYLVVTGQEAVMSTVVDTSSDEPPSPAAGSAPPTEAYHSDDLPPMPEFDEEYVAPVSPPRYTPEPPRRASPPPPPPSSPPLVASSPGKKEGRRRTIIIVAILILLCCCIAFLLSGYFIWGDLLLEFLKDAQVISP